MKQKLYAFWKNDLFPFVLGGTVTSIHKGGSVETEGYGQGFYFEPFKMVPNDEGKEIAAKLNALRTEFRIAKAKLEAEFMERRNAIIKVP